MNFKLHCRQLQPQIVTALQRDGKQIDKNQKWIVNKLLCQYIQFQVEKDRGNPGVLKVYPYPHPLKTPTLIKGRGF